MARYFNTAWIYLIALILIGMFCYEYFTHEKPCSLCILQRNALILTSLGPIFNLKFGMRGFHYGFSLLSSVFGAWVSLDQLLYFSCPNVPPFGRGFMGLQLFSWAFICFTISIALVALSLFIGHFKEKESNHKLSKAEAFAFILICLIALTNFFTTVDL